MLLNYFFEVKVRREVSRLCSRVSCISIQIKMFGDSESLLSAEAKGGRHLFEQSNSIDSDWSRLARPLLLNVSNHGMRNSENTFVKRLNNAIIIDFSS